MTLKFYKSLLNKDMINDSAKKTGFIKRVRCITGFSFLINLIFYNGDSISLRGLSEMVSSKVSRIAICKKFNKNAVLFMESVFKHVLKQKVYCKDVSCNILNNFKDIKIADSSVLTLKDSLRNIFFSAGGKKGSAALKVQLIYNYLTSSISSIALTNGNVSDQSFSMRLLPFINKGELFIGDLAYMVFNFLYEIDNKGAYFLGRYKSSRNLYELKKVKNKKGNLVNTFVKFELEKSIIHLKESVIEKELYIRGTSKKKYIKLRGVLFKNPASVANNRRRKLREIAKKKYKSGVPTEKSLFLCNWSIYMTNTTEKQIPYKMVQNIYRIRWSIELVFKTWKSILKIHKSNVKVNQYRVKVELYAKLILAVITHKVYQKNIAILAKDNKELSLHKLTDLFERNKLLIKYQALISTTKFAKIMKELTDIAMKTCIKKYQESRKTSFQIVNEKFEGYIYVP